MSHMFRMWKIRPLEKRLPQYHTFAEDDESQTYEDKYINFLPKASNVLDLVEIFEFEWEVANFGEEVQWKLIKNLHF